MDFTTLKIGINKITNSCSYPLVVGKLFITLNTDWAIVVGHRQNGLHDDRTAIRTTDDYLYSVAVEYWISVLSGSDW